MILYVDSESKVRAVNSTTDTSLTPLYVDENNDSFPFKGWSTAKICCYKVNVADGVVTMMVPYVDSRSLDMVDNLGHVMDTKTSESALADVEAIGSPASQTYNKDDTFMANGQMYRACTKIWCGSKLVENGNCERTTINAELAKIKEEEEEK